MVVNWDALMGRYDPDEETAYVAGLGAVPVSVVLADILDDAFLTIAVMKSNEVAKIKRVGRHIPAELHDALMIRNRYRCSTPGCDNWIRLERDHTIPYRKRRRDQLPEPRAPLRTLPRRRPPQDRHLLGPRGSAGP